MSARLEGLETIAGGLFVKSVSELLTLAHDAVQNAQTRVTITAEADDLLRELESRLFQEKPREPAPLVAPPIPGPPLGPFRHLFQRAFARTQRMRPLTPAARRA
jgi:hypothetical protein